MWTLSCCGRSGTSSCRLLIGELCKFLLSPLLSLVLLQEQPFRRGGSLTGSLYAPLQVDRALAGACLLGQIQVGISLTVRVSLPVDQCNVVPVQSAEKAKSLKSVPDDICDAMPILLYVYKYSDSQCCGAETFYFRSGSDFQKVSAPAPTLALTYL